jgi:hypothetical protein
MLDKKDAQWWILEAQQHPEKSPDLIRLLAERLAFVDRQNEELRAELISLKRKNQSVQTPQAAASAEVGNLQRRIHDLEQSIKQSPQHSGARHLLIYEKGRLLINRGLNAAQGDGVGDIQTTTPPRILIAAPAARLIAVGADSRLYAVNLSDLPIPDQRPITLDAPRDVIAFLDQSDFETSRYLVLVTQNGYAYSVLAATLGRLAAKQEKALRNMIPGDPLIAAFPTNNVDLLAASRGGRWTRFAEKLLGGSGAPIFELPKNDRFAALMSLGGEPTVCFVSADGRIFARPTSDLPARRAPGKASTPLFGDREMIAVGAGSTLLALTQSGALLEADLKQLPARAEGENGYALPDLSAGDRLIAAAYLP